MKKHGITLEYETRWSREEWDKIVRGQTNDGPNVLDWLDPPLEELFIQSR
jgi:hypothetical protein